MIDLLHKHDQRPDISIAQAGARIVLLELFDEPARIINADVKLVVRASQKSARQFAQFARRSVRPASISCAQRVLIDQAIFEVDPDLRVGPLEESLDLAEERLVHRRATARASSSRLSSSIGESIEREPDFAKTISQFFENVVQFAATRGRMRSNELIIRPADLLVKSDVRRAAQAAPLRVFMENSADEKRIIPDMRAKQKRLLCARPGQRDEHVAKYTARQWPNPPRRIRPVPRLAAPAIASRARRFPAERRHNRKAFDH